MKGGGPTFNDSCACMTLERTPGSSKKRDRLWKVASILDELQKNAQRCWVTGCFVAIDEQTMGFKGKHGLALHISYKREGDGYQCDALCDDGYTFFFTFVMEMLRMSQMN